jgi:hypothetical protein
MDNNSNTQDFQKEAHTPTGNAADGMQAAKPQEHKEGEQADAQGTKPEATGAVKNFQEEAFRPNEEKGEKEALPDFQREAFKSK